MHYTSIYSYAVDKDTRLQLWVDGILAEHKRDPFDLIIILGDRQVLGDYLQLIIIMLVIRFLWIVY